MKRMFSTRGGSYVAFNYLYRDASNYKRYGSVVFRNPRRRSTERLTAAVEGILRPRAYFPDVLQFRAENVKLPTLYLYEDGLPTVDDVELHEFFSIEPSTSPPDDPYGRSIDQFLQTLARSSAGEVMWANRTGT